MDKSSPSLQYRILLVGCGKMGSAMLDTWLASSLVRAAHVTDPGGLPEKFKDNPLIQHTKEVPQPLEKPDIIILATKPQTLKEAVQTLHNIEGSLILSIAAGQSLETLQNLFPPGQPVIRAMPNTPAAIGKGMSVAIANAEVSENQRNMASSLLGATGRMEWIEDESLMDAVTALSGSGPAYVFLLIEILAKAGEKLGLAPDMAMTLAHQTVVGSAALAENESDAPVSSLRQNVTSPGGTTQAALEILMNGELQDVFDQALQKAKNRAEELNT